ncbi:MAG: multi-sensor hybrid histidine kinase [Spartobacteria bacterium]|nr:multi-sensor hybrid histidine kinase [Spartobacteria bacterium]
MAKNQYTDMTASPLPALEAINRSILDSALDCIIAMDAAGVVREFNPAAERVFGYSRAEAIGQELANLIIPPALRERHRTGLAHYLKTGEGPVLNRRIEINALRRDGSEIMVELAISPLVIEGTAFFTAYLRDITDRRRGEEARRRLAAIVESSEDAILSCDLKMIISSWNNGAERLFGYDAAEIIGQPVTLLIPRERQDDEPRIIDRIRRGEGIEHYETVRVRKDGSRLNVSLTVSPIKDAAGEVIGVSKIARDITERVRSERRRLAQYTVASLLAGSWTLSEASSPILQAIAAMGEWVYGAIWLYQPGSDVLRCSGLWHGSSDRLDAFAKISQSIQFQKGKGLPGRVWESGSPSWISDVLQDRNFPRASAAADAGLRGAFAFPLVAGGSVNGVIELFSEQLVVADEDLLKLVDALGSQVGLFIERRRIEQELKNAKENAEAASAAKDRFLAMLSHELRTPLNPILIWAGGMVNEPGLSEEMQQGLRMVCRNIELEARLIEDMLDLTRITRGKLKLQLAPVDLHELMRDAIEIVRSEMEQRPLPFSFDLQATAHDLRGDGARLQQVFWNIFRNGYKFTSDSGAISVRSRNATPGWITIEIADNGVGIEPQFLEKIFDAFEQIDAGREGLGLGLAISKGIVEMHGGFIRAHSEGLGRGATFVIDLPLDGGILPA